MLHRTLGFGASRGASLEDDCHSVSPSGDDFGDVVGDRSLVVSAGCVPELGRWIVFDNFGTLKEL